MKYKELGTCVQITIPMRHLTDLTEDTEPPSAVWHEVNAMTKLAGGVTITEGEGQWFNDTGHCISESVMIYQWWLPKKIAGFGVTLAIVRAMHDAGEQCVLVQESDDRGSRAFLITAEGGNSITMRD